MRILWLNWRDIKNPQAGGAEVMTHETAKRLVKAGNDVTIFTARFPRSKEYEIVDNVKIIRCGNRLTCRYWAYREYQKYFKGKVDLVIDEINIIPFFTNFYVIERKVALIHQLAREYWWSETFFPFNLFGYLLEPLYLKLYKNTNTIAASASTKTDLENLGFKKVHVFHQGLSVKPLKIVPQKTKDLKILFIGRLTRPKGPQDAITAFKKIGNSFPNSKLVIVGKGKKRFTSLLKKLVSDLNLKDKVVFEGFATQKRKVELLKQAQIILIPSAREGWNLVPIEANSFGAVPIGYNVTGLRDSIQNGKTGILTKTNTPSSLAISAITIIKNRKFYIKMQNQGLAWAKKFSWQRTCLSFTSVINAIPYSILWLSWRDIKNPDAGGAEKVAIEAASRFVRDKTKVTIFTSKFKNAQAQEQIRGVTILRRGNLLTCRLHSFFFYLAHASSFDLVIDEINTIPFFTPFYCRKKTIALVHQLAREYWFSQILWPLNFFGYLLEPLTLKIYRNLPTLVVSNSTKKDLENLNFKNIRIIREGLDIKPEVNTNKRDLILFIGRLTTAKGPQDAITAFAKIVKELPSTRLYIIGQGNPKFSKSLKQLVLKLKLQNKVAFTGFISQSQKIAMLKKARVVLIPSVREGWNLVATEANATFCVPVAYNVAGLRDSVRNNKTGLLVDSNPDALARGAVILLKNESLRQKLAQRGYIFSQHFSWENTYKDIKSFILSEKATGFRPWTKRILSEEKRTTAFRSWKSILK